MAKVALIAKLTAQPGKGDELVAAFDELFRQVDKEEGTLQYILHRGTEPDQFFFYELYTDNDALAAHGSSDVMKRAAGAFGPLIAGSEMFTGEVVRGKGV